MKLQVLGFVAVMALVPAGARAQVPPCCIPLNQALLDKVVPVLQAEAGANVGFWWDQRAARGMTKTEYIALKNALIAARLDAGTPGRLVAIKDDMGARNTRQANVTLYQANKARLDAVLTKVHADGCGPACSANSPPPAKTGR